MMKKTLILSFAAILLTSCGGHFISDSSYREKVMDDLSVRRTQFAQPYFSFADNGKIGNEKISSREKEALSFLYAYMPAADITDYPVEFYLENVRMSFLAASEMSWGKDVPELLFRHFVLPLRANNEDLDDSRKVFYEELKPRVQGLSMKEAILEVNHWCHEKVTYQPSDARTSSPLASVKTAAGRCGEESTFTVAALRAVGIPARQVYTPRWAHTDDNHAWVEAWADGQWWFIGACEPEPVLNLGWFNAPASRAMLMHTKAFGKYEGPEEVVLRSPHYTEINLISNYAQTAEADIIVKDTEGNPVDSARVDFRIYNYSEFYPAVAKYTDAEGRTSLSAGLGDMLAWASKDGRFGFSVISFGKDEEVAIVLDKDSESDNISLPIYIVPPPENVALPDVTPEMRAENDARFAYEDSLRNAYTATFFTRDAAIAFAAEKGLPSEAARCLVESCGNHDVISDFLLSVDDKERALDLLNTLSRKDLRDITPDILWDSYIQTSSILAPRVENEFLSPYKTWFRENVPAELQTSFTPSSDTPEAVDTAVDNITSWLKDNVTVDTNPLSWRIPMSPKGVWQGRYTDERSRNIAFIALARTFGIDARKDVVTGKIQYRPNEDADWKDVTFGAGVSSVSTPSGTLLLTYTPTANIDNPGYYSHFTISRISGGRTSLLGFDEGEVDMGGGMNFNAFRKGVRLDEGQYILASGSRLADGSVPVSMNIFQIRRDAATKVPITIGTIDNAVSIIGSFDAESKYMPFGGAERKSVLSQTGRGYYTLAVLGVGAEPTNHVLRDLSAAKAELEVWGRPIVLLTTSVSDMERLQEDIKAGKYGTLPSTVIFGVDTDGSILGSIASEMKLREQSLPHVIVADTFNHVVFASQGYTIGIGATIANLSSKLK